MVCPDGEKVPFERLEENCYPCATKNRTMDHEHANIYVFSEMVVVLLSYVPGFRQGENAEDLYKDAVASHGFNPDQVNQAVFDQPQCEL